MYMITSKLFTLPPIKNETNNNKHVICQLYNMKLQKEVKSNPKQPSCKKVFGPVVKKDVKSKVAAKKWLW